MPGSRFENVQDLRVDAVVAALSAEAANARTLSMQFVDRFNGNEVGERVAVGFYLADDANGDTPSAVAPSAGIAAGTDGALREYIADLAGLAISEVDGDLDITITEAGVKSYYVIFVMPDGKLISSGAVAFA